MKHTVTYTLTVATPVRRQPRTWSLSIDSCSLALSTATALEALFDLCPAMQSACRHAVRRASVTITVLRPLPVACWNLRTEGSSGLSALATTRRRQTMVVATSVCTVGRLGLFRTPITGPMASSAGGMYHAATSTRSPHTYPGRWCGCLSDRRHGRSLRPFTSTVTARDSCRADFTVTRIGGHIIERRHYGNPPTQAAHQRRHRRPSWFRHLGPFGCHLAQSISTVTAIRMWCLHPADRALLRNDARQLCRPVRFHGTVASPSLFHVTRVRRSDTLGASVTRCRLLIRLGGFLPPASSRHSGRTLRAHGRPEW